MKVTVIKQVNGRVGQTPVLDCNVGKGYIKAQQGSLPDIDTDFSSEHRPLVKEYLEKRYNKGTANRVFSAGTFTTEKARSVIKDIARVHKLSVGTVNYITSIIESEGNWTDIMKTAFKEKKVYDFIQKNWEVFEEIYPIMGQPRSAGIHASAYVITPDVVNGKKVDCFDVIPMRKMDGQLVSELSGVEIDEAGFLKNDVLSIAELGRLFDIIDICNREYGLNLSLESIVDGDLGDAAVFDMLGKGYNQGVFQLSGDGMGKYIKRMRPTNINDLIVSIALFRPGTLESGAAEQYVDFKNELAEPEYLWGTYEILKDTYGLMCFQESISQVAQKIGGLSLGDGVNLVKALSKKKVEKVRKFKEKYFDGAKKNGCPEDAAKKIWEDVELAAKYCFNRSHAVAYGLTAYAGAWLKVHYPVAFYTVLLKWVDKDKLPTLMNEMREIGDAEVVQPNINISGIDFETDYKAKKIYWSLSRIAQLGAKAVRYIMTDRELFGKYDSLEHFIERIFKYKLKVYQYWDDPDNPDEFQKCPVNARSIKNLIMAGAFDELERVGNVCERLGLLTKAAHKLGFEVSEKDVPDDMKDKHYFWSQQQINISGFGSVDYRRIYNGMSSITNYKKSTYTPLKDIQSIMRPERGVSVCATIAEVREKTYKDKTTGKNKVFGKVTLLQNTDICDCVIWSDAWKDCKHRFVGREGGIIVIAGSVKWSDYDERNQLIVNQGGGVMNV